MHKQYLGDSFDIVKRFWAERLGDIAPLFAHPRFVPSDLTRPFETMVAMPVLSLAAPPPLPFGLFLDPHTGIPLPTAASHKASASHAPLSFICAEVERLKPKYLICFDQSHDRASRLSRREQRDSKREALRLGGLACFYYVSHAPFLFAAKAPSVIAAIRSRLVESGIPPGRFESEEANG